MTVRKKRHPGLTAGVSSKNNQQLNNQLNHLNRTANVQKVSGLTIILLYISGCHSHGT